LLLVRKRGEILAEDGGEEEATTQTSPSGHAYVTTISLTPLHGAEQALSVMISYSKYCSTNRRLWVDAHTREKLWGHLITTIYIRPQAYFEFIGNKL
jgi:hypothetical protein